MTERAGSYTVLGSGKVGPQTADDDVVEAALIGIVAGLMALIAIGALFGTSEYRKGLIRTTFTATPGRCQVLAAKAIVLGTVTFVVSLIAVVGAFLVAAAILRKNGMGPPAFPDPSRTDGTVIRTLVLTGLFMTAVTLFALAIGMLLRRSVAAITLAIGLIVLPLIAGLVLPGTSPRWVIDGKDRFRREPTRDLALLVRKCGCRARLVVPSRRAVCAHSSSGNCILGGVKGDHQQARRLRGRVRRVPAAPVENIEGGRRHMSSHAKGGPVSTDLPPRLRPPGVRLSSVKDRPVLRLVPDPVCDLCGDAADPRLLDPRGVCENCQKPKTGRDCNCRSCTYGDPPTRTP